MLLGTYSAKLAENHRLYFHALRKDLGQELVVAKWYEECLVVSKQAWNADLERVVGKNNLVTNPVRGSEHFIFQEHMSSDDQGRIVIPEVLIKYGHLSDDIYFLGVGDETT